LTPPKVDMSHSAFYLDRKFTTFASEDYNVPHKETDIFGVSWRRDLLGSEEMIKVLKDLGTFVTMNTARAIGAVMTDLLANAQPRVPVDTGELRRSGRATLNFIRGAKKYKDIAWGRADGTIKVDSSVVNRGFLKNVTRIEGTVHYSRFNEKEQDIAQWAHEDLLPYESEEHPRARTEGTGPKYLEIPWLEKENDYLAYLKEELAGVGFESILSQSLLRTKKTIGEYTINYTKIVFSKIEHSGYYPAFLAYR